MDGPRESNHAALWLGVGLLGFVLVWVVAIAFVVAKQPRFFRSPTQVFESDQQWYDKVFDSASFEAAPDLQTYPKPEISKKKEPSPWPGFDDVIFSSNVPQYPSTRRHYENFYADELGVVSLPDGNKLTISAIGLVLPSDAEWSLEGKPTDLVPEWIDPKTGAVFTGQDGEKWKQPRPAPRTWPKLYFHVEVEGDEPIRWRIPSIHDSRTRRSVGIVDGSGTLYEDGFFAKDLELWNQTSLDIGIEFAFGDPEIEQLPIEAGAEVRFDDHALVRIEEVFPSSYRVVRYDRDNGTIFNVPARLRPTNQQGAAVLVWPPHQDDRLEFQPYDSYDPRKVSASRGVGGLRWKNEKGRNKESELTVIRYPRLGRAVFHLDKIPRLPEVENLFEAPIPKIYVKYGGNLPMYIADAAGVKRSVRVSSNDFHASEFPRFFSDTTPEELIEFLEEKTETRLYYDEKAGSLTDQKPPGFFERLEAWWRIQRIRWMP